jgi:hypothetical protein
MYLPYASCTCPAGSERRQRCVTRPYELDPGRTHVASLVTVPLRHLQYLRPDGHCGPANIVSYMMDVLTMARVLRKKENCVRRGPADQAALTEVRAIFDAIAALVAACRHNFLELTGSLSRQPKRPDCVRMNCGNHSRRNSSTMTHK